MKVLLLCQVIRGACLIFLAAAYTQHDGYAETAATSAPVGKHVLRLNLNEFSILNVSEMDGLLKYGGSGEFRLQMAKRGDAVVWTVTIDNPRLMELLGIFVGEKTMKLVQSLDPNNLDANQKLALEAVKSLTQKLEDAQKYPVWDSVKLAGTVAQQGTNWVIQTASGPMLVAGTNAGAVSSWAGRGVVADGFVKVPGQFELARVIEQRTNTLELFVMSQCPFGQRAEMKLYNFLESTNVVDKPKLEIRYIFYKQQKDGKDVYFSLHGDEEITENLVQMVLRDHYAPLFEHYVRQRAGSGNLPWRKLLERVGLDKSFIDEIEARITSQREALIQAEFNYVTVQYGISDGSPSYVWESQRVMDLTKVKMFNAMKDFTGEACNN